MCVHVCVVYVHVCVFNVCACMCVLRILNTFLTHS